MARRFVRTQGKGRLSLWLGMSPSSTTMTAGGGTIVYTFNAAALALRPVTILRTHMTFALRSDQEAAMEQQTAAFGWCVVSNEAAAVGVSAVPTPISELGSDLWFASKLIYGDESKLIDKVRSETRVDLDSKAMRKVNDGEQPVGVAEMSGTDSGGCILRIYGRMLVLAN